MAQQRPVGDHLATHVDLRYTSACIPRLAPPCGERTMANLKEMMKAFAAALGPSEAEKVGKAAAASTRVLDLSRASEKMLAEALSVAMQVTKNATVETELAAIISRLRGPTELIRQKATDDLYEFLSARILGKSGGFSLELVEAMLERAGSDALLLIPGMADSYRRHIAAGGQAETFAKFILSSRNKHVLLALANVFEHEKLSKLLRTPLDRIIRLTSHATRSTPAQRDAVFKALKEARKLLGDDLFFEILTSKSGARAGDGDVAEFARRLDDLLSNSSLPEIPLENLARCFRMADRVAVQGPMGELLAFSNLTKKAAELAEKEGKDVFILLQPTVGTMRTSVEKAKRGLFAGAGSALDDAEEQGIRAAEQLMNASVETVRRKTQEFTDGLIVSMDPKTGVKALCTQECKVDQRGIVAAIEQLDKTKEDIEAMLELGFGAVFRVAKDGTITKLSPSEVRAVSGAEQIGERFVLKESEKLADRLEELRKLGEKRALTAVEAAEENALRAERKLRNFKGAENLVVTGIEQSSRATVQATGVMVPQGAQLVPYGHDYETVIDVAVKLLGILPYREAI